MPEVLEQVRRRMAGRSPAPTRLRRLLIVSHGPEKKTGFGGQANAIATAFADDGWEVARLCLHSWRCGVETDADGTRLYRVVDYPSFQDAATTIYRESPDAIIIATEFSWVAAALQPLPEDIRDKCFFWNCVDCEPYSDDLGHFANHYGTIVNVSNFGHAMYSKVGRKPAVNIPMGADPEVFRLYDMAEREALRREFNLQDKFVIAHVAQNQQRKQQPVGLEAFKEFMSEAPEAFMILHTAQNGFLPANYQSGWDLARLKTKILDIPDSRAMWNEVNCESWELAQLYAAADVYTDFSSSEGFGIPRVEAQMAGLRTITPDNTTGPELRGPGSWGYACNNKYWQADLCVFRPLPDPKALLVAWREAYALWRAGKLHAGREERRAWACEHFDITKITDKWKSLVYSRTSRPVAPIEVKTKVLYQGLMTKDFSYGIAGNGIVRGLKAKGLDVWEFPISVDCFRDPEGHNITLTESALGGLGFDLHIRWAYPLQPRGLMGRKNLCITPFEWARTPTQWVTAAHDPRIHKVVAISEGSAADFVASGMPHEKVDYIDLGIDHEIFHPGVKAERFEHQAGFTFTVMGSLMEWNSRKRLDLAVEAFLTEFTHQESVTLIIKTIPINGQDFSKAHLQARVQAAGPRHGKIIYFCGDWPRAKVAEALAVTDALLSPVAGEGCGMVNREAAAMGIPSICPDIGGLKWVHKHDCGYPVHSRLVPAGPSPYLLKQEDVPIGGWQWHDVDIAELRFQMRAAFEKKDYDVKRRNCIAAAQKLTWERTAGQLCKM